MKIREHYVRQNEEIESLGCMNIKPIKNLVTLIRQTCEDVKSVQS